MSEAEPAQSAEIERGEAERASSELWRNVFPEPLEKVESNSVVIIEPRSGEGPPTMILLYDSSKTMRAVQRQIKVLDDLKIPGVRIAAATVGSPLGRQLDKMQLEDPVVHDGLGVDGSIGGIRKNHFAFSGTQEG